MGKKEQVVDEHALIHKQGSMFGKLANSRRRSMPVLGFGSSSRDDARKVFCTAEHAAKSVGVHSPGPVYGAMSTVSGNIPKGGTRNIQSHKFSKSERFPWHAKVVLKPRKDDEQEVDASITGMGTQVLATKRSMPSWGFGRATRDEVRKTVDGMFNKDFQYAAEYPRPSPGPTRCWDKSSMGRQVVGGKPSNPSWPQMADRRFRGGMGDVGVGNVTPAAGCYDMPGGMGKQPDKKHTLPSWSFGTGSRDALQKLYVSKEAEKDFHGRWTPGPGKIMLPGGFGKQADTRKRSSSAWGFGSTERFCKVGGDVAAGAGSPGPGTYSPE